MTNALALFDPNNVPDHIRALNQEHANIGDKMSVDSLTYKGKIWTVSVGGTKTPLMKKTEDGDEEPRTIVPLVVLDYNKRRGRSWYEGGFDDNKPAVPSCWSPDGIAPDKTSEKLQSDKCSTCPLAVKGSRHTDNGQPTAACSQFRMVAVQLYKRWDFPPLRLRLAITSDYDAKSKENEAKGWFAFQQLTDTMRARGVKHTGSLVIRAKFDPSVAYPKVLFQPVNWISEEEKDIIVPLSESDEVKQLLSPTYTPAAGVKDQAPPAEEEPDEDAPAPTPAAKPKAVTKAGAPVVTPKAKVAPVAAAPAIDDVGDIVDAAEDDEDEAQAPPEEDDDDDAATKAAAEAQRKAAEKQAAKVKAAQDEAAKRKAAAAAPPPAEEDEDEGEVTITTPEPKAKAPAPKAAPAKAAAAAAPSTKVAAGKAAVVKAPSPAVASTLADWTDDDE